MISPTLRMSLPPPDLPPGGGDRVLYRGRPQPPSFLGQRPRLGAALAAGSRRPAESAGGRRALGWREPGVSTSAEASAESAPFGVTTPRGVGAGAGTGAPLRWGNRRWGGARGRGTSGGLGRAFGDAGTCDHAREAGAGRGARVGCGRCAPGDGAETGARPRGCVLSRPRRAT